MNLAGSGDSDRGDEPFRSQEEGEYWMLDLGTDVDSENPGYSSRCFFLQNDLRAFSTGPYSFDQVTQNTSAQLGLRVPRQSFAGKAFAENLILAPRLHVQQAASLEPN